MTVQMLNETRACKRLHAVMVEERGQTVAATRLDQILPLVLRLCDRLATGLDVMDVGCGSGRALIEMAETFPDSRFTGLDISEEALGAGRAEAQRRGLTNVQFTRRDVAELTAEGVYDLITAFDAIHDQAQSARVLENIYRALRPGGVFLMQDSAASSPVKMLQEAGFRSVRTDRLPHDFQNLYYTAEKHR